MEIFSILEAVDDPRRDHLKEYSLECLFYITIAAVLGGAESWYEVAEFGRMREDFFRSRIKDFRSVPSHDTFNRILSNCVVSDIEGFLMAFGRRLLEQYLSIIAAEYHHL